MAWIGRLDKIAEERRKEGWRNIPAPFIHMEYREFFLQGGLYEMDDERIVIVWPNSSILAACNPWAYHIAYEVLSQLGADPADADRKVKRVLIFEDSE
jgi:hypothetical protein